MGTEGVLCSQGGRGGAGGSGEGGEGEEEMGGVQIVHDNST